METELDTMVEIAAHLYTAHQLAVLQVQRMEVRNMARLRQARKRLNAPTTHDDALLRQQQSA